MVNFNDVPDAPVESYGSYEALLEAIARTQPWDEDDILRNVRDYQAMLKTVRDKIDGVRSWMVQSGEFDCSARDGMYDKATAVVRNINEHYTANERFEKVLSTAMRERNQGIVEANNVMLPGDHLDAAQGREIMESTEPLNVFIPHLGTLTGVMGITGFNLVSQLLKNTREDKAKEKYKEIMGKISNAEGKPPEAIPVVDMPEVEVPGPGPVPDPEDHDGFGWNGSSGGLGVAAGAGAVAAVGAGVAASRAGQRVVGVASRVSGGSDGAVVSRGGAVARSAGVASGSVGSSGSLPAGDDRVHGSSGGGGDHYSDDDGNYLYRWDADGTYRYDPDKEAWVRTDAKGADVDSYSMQGVSGLSSVASGTGVAAAGAAAVGIAGRAGAASSAAAGSLMGVAGAGGSLGAVGGAASGVGSFYANNPVAATISPASSIRGAQGLAAGLRSDSAAAGAAGANGRANPAMMGGMGAGGNGGDGKKRQRLGYVAPVIEEEEEFAPMPIGNMAGHRRTDGEA